MTGFSGWLIATLAFALLPYAVSLDKSWRDYLEAVGYVLFLQFVVGAIIFGLWLMAGAPIS